MSLLDRIANYFKEWDGIDETAPKMELSIHDLRYIADMNVERCRLIRQLNEANLKTEKLLTDKTAKIRAKAIDELISQLEAEVESSAKFIREYDDSIAQKAYFKGLDNALKIAKGMKGGAE